MAKAGHFALVKAASSTTTTFTDEPTTTTDDQTYRITDETKTPWCRECTITVEDGGVPTTESFTLNRLTGQVIFDTVDITRDITVSGEFHTMSVLAEASEFTYTIEASNEDTTFFGERWMNRTQALKDFTGSTSQFDEIDRTMFDNLDSGTTFVIEFFHDRTLGNTEWDLRAWILISTDEFSAAVDGVQQQSIDFEGNTDADERIISSNP